MDWNTLSEVINTAVMGGGQVGTNTSFTVGVRDALFGVSGIMQVMSWLMPWLIAGTMMAAFYGAFLYFTAYGNEQKAVMAKKVIITALVGFVISGLSFTIVTFFGRIFISQSVEDSMTNNALPGANRTEIESRDSLVVPTGGSNPFESGNILGN